VIRQVRLYPDPVLLEVCAPAGEADADRLVADLVDTMRSLPGCVGLAAPQIGEPLRVAVVDCSRHRASNAGNGLLALVNPRLVEGAGREVGREGCQSLPWWTVDVQRFRRIVVEARAGMPVWCTGIEARAVQHELDHLDGGDRPRPGGRRARDPPPADEPAAVAQLSRSAAAWGESAAICMSSIALPSGSRSQYCQLPSRPRTGSPVTSRPRPASSRSTARMSSTRRQ
jgi:peptide deformylase